MLDDLGQAIFDFFENLMQPILDFCEYLKNWFIVDWDQVKIQIQERGPYQKFLEKFGPLVKVQEELGNLQATNLDENPAVFTMQLPQFLGGQEVTILDLSLYSTWFSWGRIFLKSTLWIGFAMWVLQEFRVRFNIA